MPTRRVMLPPSMLLLPNECSMAGASAQMYQGGAQPGAGAQQNAGGQSNANAGNSSSDDTIQDADFEEVK